MYVCVRSRFSEETIQLLEIRITQLSRYHPERLDLKTLAKKDSPEDWLEQLVDRYLEMHPERLDRCWQSLRDQCPRDQCQQKEKGRGPFIDSPRP